MRRDYAFLASHWRYGSGMTPPHSTQRTLPASCSSAVTQSEIRRLFVQVQNRTPRRRRHLETNARNLQSSVGECAGDSSSSAWARLLSICLRPWIFRSELALLMATSPMIQALILSGPTFSVKVTQRAMFHESFERSGNERGNRNNLQAGPILWGSRNGISDQEFLYGFLRDLLACSSYK